MELKGKKIVVLGGSSGIGLSVARAAAKEGAGVIIASRSVDKLERAREMIGSGTAIRSLDVTEEAEVRAFFDESGRFDHLVSTAAEGPIGDFLRLDTADAKVMMESKFWGQYHAAKYGAPHLNEGGSITFTTGVLAKKPAAGTSILSAINGGLEALARALALELSPLRVNAVSPGIIDTPLYGGLEDEARENYFANLAESLPVGKIGQPEDVAEAVLFLMKNTFTTGTVLDVDGGHPLQ